MKTIIILISFLFLTQSSPSADGNPNLVSNPGFETSEKGSLAGWFGSINDGTLIHQGAPKGGNWSVRLFPEMRPGEGFLETFVSGLDGEEEYIFSVSMKNVNWPGKIVLGKKNKNTRTILKEKTNNTPDWTTVGFTERLQLSKEDTLFLRLSAGSAPLSRGEVYFDNVEFRKKK